MKSNEPFILEKSEYYNYQPSQIARQTFFYPIAIGHFFYEKGYQQYRNSYDSFLLIYIVSGTLRIDMNGTWFDATKYQFVLLDCYRPHGYQATDDCECLWFHFDGCTADSYVSLITEKLTASFYSRDSYYIVEKIRKLYDIFNKRQTIREAEMSKLITDILTALLLSESDSEASAHEDSIGSIVTYINEHFDLPLSIDLLAKQASLSPYYFIRTFKKQTGFTPHEYIIHTRINAAKYLLKSTSQSVRSICFECGFSSESVFCNAFKKKMKMTPAEYRSHGGDV